MRNSGRDGNWTSISCWPASAISSTSLTRSLRPGAQVWWSCAAASGSQVEHQVASGLGAADQRASLGGIIDRVGGVPDRPGHQVGLTGVAHAGAA
jgi:hypothetical protein